MLKLKDSKTEMVVFVSPRVKLPALSIPVGAESHQPAGHVKTLGMNLDVYLTMEVHIKRVFQVSYFQLKTIKTVQIFCHLKPLRD